MMRRAGKCRRRQADGTRCARPRGHIGKCQKRTATGITHFDSAARCWVLADGTVV